MISSRSFRKKQDREAARAGAPNITHSEIMRKRGSHRSLQAPGDIKKYKGGTRIAISENESYSVYAFNMPGSNGSGEYKITGGNQTLIVLSGVLFVSKADKKKGDNITLRADDSITFSKGDVVSFCPNSAPMSGILIESGALKVKKNSDPIANNTGVEVFRNTRTRNLTPQNRVGTRRADKSDAEREEMGRAYMAARGIPDKGMGVQTNVAGIPTSPSAPVPESNDKVNPAAAVVEGENPKPMGDKEE